MEIRQVILEKAEALFMRYGIKSITMDDVARELGISKKTLYQYFSTKDELILQVLQHNQHCELQSIETIRTSAASALDEILEIARHVIRQLQQMSPSLVYDLKKYHGEAWKMVEQMERSHIYGIIRQNLEKGIHEGLYRDDFNPDIMARIYLGSINLVIGDHYFQEKSFPVDQIFREYIRHYLRGIVTPKGLELLEQNETLKKGSTVAN